METDFDVVIVGGALSGSSTALLLKREHPEMRILMVELSEVFDRKVGEATTEVSGEFFHRRLGLATHLAHHQLPKQSLRMWFDNGPDTPFDETVEIGAGLQSRHPAYQLDRSVFDQHLLDTAHSEGVHVWRPAKVKTVDTDGPATLEIERDGETRSVSCRWVVDASGPSAFLSKSLGHFQRTSGHPTASLWARFKGVKDWDSAEVRKKYKRYGSTGLVSRALATNHLAGYGWWCWIIPLKGGDFSAGIVYDTRLFTLPDGPSPGARLKAHILQSPVGREFFAEAEVIDGDVRARAQLPYVSHAIAGKHWQLVGDAAGFIDPLYSPGMDYCSWTARLAFSRISREFRGESVDLETINANFRESYHTWFEALYKDKYYYIGDAQLMSAAYLLDIGLFFLGPGHSTIRHHGGDDANCLPFIGPVDRMVGRFMRFYNRRLSAIARKRRAAGCYGLHNSGWQELYTNIGPNVAVVSVLWKGIARWLHAELHTLTLTKPAPMPAPVPSTA